MMKKSIGSGRGSVYNVLLKALQTGDKYAYEICKEIEEKSNGTYVLKEQSSYSGLRRLEQRNEITSYWKDSALGGRRHYYSLTEKGRQRLENSNFSWEDTRDEIVDNLFERSEVDKQISTVSQDLEDIKSSVSTQNQSDIDEIISKTDSLVKENEIVEEVENTESEQIDDNKQDFGNEFQNNENDNKDKVVENVEEEQETKQDGFINNQTDLFSIFADYSSNNDNLQKQETHENQESVEDDDLAEQNLEEHDEKIEEELQLEQNSNDEDLDDEFNELDTDKEINEDDKNDINEDTQINEYNDELHDSNDNSEINEDEKQAEQTDDLFEINKISENDAEDIEQSEIFDEQEQNNIYQNEYETIANSTLNEESNCEDDNKLEETEEIAEDNAEEKIETKDDFGDVFKNLQTVDGNKSNQTENFEYEKTNEQSLSKNDVDIDFYRQMHKSTNNYIDNTYQEKSTYNFFSDDKFGDTVLDDKNVSGNTPLDDEYVDKISSFENNFSESKDLTSDSNNNQTNENTKSIDYKDIFGDLVSKNNESNQFDDKNSLNENFDELSRNNQFTKDDTTDSFSNKNSSSSIIMETKSENPSENNFDIAQQSNINDINRTLKSDGKSRIDEMYEIQNAYNENEKYGQNYYQNDYQYESQEIDTINNVSFDKKYDNLENNFDVPNYKIRYQQKHPQKRQSRYLLSNKLNLIACLMLSMMLAICNTITLLICKALDSPNSQIVFCNVCYILIAVVLLFHLAKYIINPAKRAHNFSKYDLIVSASISAIILVFTFMINIWSGMTFSNLANFFASLIMPLFFAIALLLSHTAKKVLSKSPKFYK